MSWKEKPKLIDLFWYQITLQNVGLLFCSPITRLEDLFSTACDWCEMQYVGADWKRSEKIAFDSIRSVLIEWAKCEQGGDGGAQSEWGASIYVSCWVLNETELLGCGIHSWTQHSRYASMAAPWFTCHFNGHQMVAFFANEIRKSCVSSIRKMWYNTFAFAIAIAFEITQPTLLIPFGKVTVCRNRRHLFC